MLDEYEPGTPPYGPELAPVPSSSRPARLNSVQGHVQRIRELATQATNETLSDEDRAAIQAEIDEHIAEIDRTAEQTQFNGQNLLNGDIAAGGSGVNVATTTDGRDPRSKSRTPARLRWASMTSMSPSRQVRRLRSRVRMRRPRR